MNFDNLIWTDREIAILEEFYPYASHSELEKLLPNRKKTAIVAKASKLNIRRIIKIWSKEELSLLKKHYPSQANNEELLVPQCHKCCKPLFHLTITAPTFS